ncbi:hypothetical protein ACIRQQ_10555 [Streptomyces fuscichromogenes]|uniref:hypothetical protein n=1 Tax=Streptomyces fuscichromogenes TaxID=1324013 RepID=UPI0037FF76FF
MIVVSVCGDVKGPVAGEAAMVLGVFGSLDACWLAHQSLGLMEADARLEHM